MLCATFRTISRRLRGFSGAKVRKNKENPLSLHQNQPDAIQMNSTLTSMQMDEKATKHYEVTCAVIRFGSKVLCMQKAATRFPYTSFRWEFPGGKIEHGETPQQALQREIEEEMNMKVNVSDAVGKVEHAYPDFSITLEAFWCDVTSPRFEMKEHNDFRWLPINELPFLDWAAADRKVVGLILDELP